MSRGSRLETATNIAVLVAAVFVVVYFARLSLGAGTTASGPEGPPLGMRFANLEGFDWSAHDRTLVLALRTDCVYCEASIPFYRQLAAVAQASNPPFALLSAFPQPVSEVERHQSSAGLRIQAVANADLHALGVDGTPTLILVDRRGTVLKTWVGQLPPDGELEVFRTLQAAPSP